MYNASISDVNIHVAERRGLCPICGRNMSETERLKEGNKIFVWYKCIDEDCGGQRLQKRSCA